MSPVSCPCNCSALLLHSQALQLEPAQPPCSLRTSDGSPEGQWVTGEGRVCLWIPRH